MSQSKKDIRKRSGGSRAGNTRAGPKGRKRTSHRDGAALRDARRASRAPPAPRAGRAHKELKRAWSAWLQSNGPVVRFVALFATVLAVFYLVYLPLSQSEMYGLHLGLIAEASGQGLRVLGQQISVNGPSIVSPRFSVQVVPGCDGMEATALFASAVLASPVALRSRVLFVLAGTAALWLVNIVRLISLFCIGVYFPTAVEAVHWDLWPGVLIVVILICWLIWARWAWQYRRVWLNATW